VNMCVYLWNKERNKTKNIKTKTMTTYQKTKQLYIDGYKSMAYLAFLNDTDSNKGISFEQFCNWFDKVIANN
jgi:hypothetical protein